MPSKDHEKPKTDGPCCGCSPRRDRDDSQETGDQANLSLQAFGGTVATSAGPIPRVPTRLSFADKLGAWKTRWGIRRMSYRVKPGLYAVGNPGGASPVLVTANFKLSFDRLRRELGGLDAWILVLDTKGINVWCAAGKGTFGTEEIIRRAGEARLAEIVAHRTLILPQLGAPGVAAHEVQAKTGFRVFYGPVRASDLKTYLAGGRKATADMRTVRFGVFDRLVLAPMELAGTLRYVLIGLAAIVLMNVLAGGRPVFAGAGLLLGAVIVGSVFVPLLLPWIPGRAFAWKGWLLGVVWVLGYLAWRTEGFSGGLKWPAAATVLLLYPAISAFVAMNFTGSSTFTSLSGVVKEMRRAVPLTIVSAALGLLLLVLGMFLKL